MDSFQVKVTISGQAGEFEPVTKPELAVPLQGIRSANGIDGNAATSLA
jgi:hypothetical protein